MELPPSPALSEVPTSPDPSSPALSEIPTSPGDTQAPAPSIRERLPKYGISIEKAKMWNLIYNRQEMPLMPEEEFYELIARVVQEQPNAANIELKLANHIKEEDARLDADFGNAVYGPLFYGFKVFATNEKQSAFSRGITRPYTVYDFKALIIQCLPDLIERARKSTSEVSKRKKATRGQKRKPKAQQHKKPPMHKQCASEKVAKRSPTRRSDRIKQHQEMLSVI